MGFIDPFHVKGGMRLRLYSLNSDFVLRVPPPTPPQSKGGILSKACDYIRELRQTNQRMQETFKEAERLQMDNDLLRQQVTWPFEMSPLLRAWLLLSLSRGGAGREASCVAF